MSILTAYARVKNGFILFKQTKGDEYVHVTIDIQSLPNGEHSIHIHDIYGKHFCVAESYSAQFKGGVPHGSWEDDTIRHNGDMCNNILSVNGIARFEYDDLLLSLVPGHPFNIVGCFVVINEYLDDKGYGKNTQSLIDGNSGKVLLSGEIIMVNTY